MSDRTNVQARANPRIQLYGFEKRLIVEAMEAVERVRFHLVAPPFVEALDEGLFSGPGDVFDLPVHGSSEP